MVVRRITCPICGNDTRVNNTRNAQKCEFCRRPLNVKFERNMKSGKRHDWKFSAEPGDDFQNKRGK